MISPDTQPAAPAAAPSPTETSDADLLRAATEADNASAASLEPATPAEPAAEKPEGTTGQPPEAAAQGKQPEKDPNAKPDPAPDTKKAETDFAKKQAEVARRDKSWKALDEEKQKFRAEEGALRSEVDTLRRELTQLKQRPAPSAGPAKDEHGHTAEDYAQLARSYRQEGRDDLAEAALARADKLRHQPATATAPTHAPGSPEAFAAPEFQKEWQGHVQAIIQAEPDLAKAEHPLVRATNALLQDPTYGRFFKTHPDGIRAAVEVVKIMRTADEGRKAQEELKAAREELKKLGAEKARLDGLLQPRSGQPTGPVPTARTGAELSDAELLAAASAADRGEL